MSNDFYSQKSLLMRISDLYERDYFCKKETITMMQSTNGQLFFCKNCLKYHLEFGNTFFDFSENEFLRFREYINSVDAESQSQANRHALTRRKVLLPTYLKGFRFCFSVEEINELKDLINLRRNNRMAIQKTINLDILNKNYTLN